MRTKSGHAHRSQKPAKLSYNYVWNSLPSWGWLFSDLAVHESERSRCQRRGDYEMALRSSGTEQGKSNPAFQVSFTKAIMV